MATKTFVNLSVKDLNKSIKFYTKLGFTFNPQFTNERATCMVIGENIFAMLLVEDFFKTFTEKDICNPLTHSEVILALAVESKQQVNEMIKKVLEAGGIEPREPQDYDWMYGRSFQDIDGHLWEIFYIKEI